MKNFKAAAVQINPAPNDIQKNIEKVCRWHKRAVEKFGAELVVFPETVTTGFNHGMEAEEFYSFLPESIEKSLAPVMKVSRETSTFCALPSYERGNGKIYNSTFLIDDKGSIAGVYRKTHLFPTEDIKKGGWTSPGTEAPVFDTKLGKIGIMICYDGDFPEISRALALGGAEIILRPSALLRRYEIWEISNRMRAYENDIFVVGSNAVGSDAAGSLFFGHSMIVSPTAEMLKVARAGEEIIAARLDPESLEGGIDSSTPVVFKHLEDRNTSI